MTGRSKNNAAALAAVAILIASIGLTAVVLDHFGVVDIFAVVADPPHIVSYSPSGTVSNPTSVTPGLWLNFRLVAEPTGAPIRSMSVTPTVDGATLNPIPLALAYETVSGGVWVNGSSEGYRVVGTAHWAVPAGKSYQFAFRVIQTEGPSASAQSFAQAPVVITQQQGALTVRAYVFGTAVVANVSVAGQTKATPCTFALNPGTYTITATRHSETITNQVTIAAGESKTLDIPFTYADPTSLGTLSVRAYYDSNELPGVSVHIEGNGQRLDVQAPSETLLPAGTYTVTASYQGTPKQSTATVSASQTTPVDLKWASAPATGTLNVGVTLDGQAISGASITVNGQTKAAPCSLSVPAGIVDVKASYNGASQTKQATIEAGKTATLSFAFVSNDGGVAPVEESQPWMYYAIGAEIAIALIVLVAIMARSRGRRR